MTELIYKKKHALRMTLKFVKQDMWIGVFWRHYKDYHYGEWHLWICLLPCFPLHIQYPVYPTKEVTDGK